MSTFVIVTKIIESYQYKTPYTLPSMSGQQFKEVFDILREMAL